MEIVREKEIEFCGKKEIVKVTLTIPVPPNKTKEEIAEECGDVEFEDITTEQATEIAFGDIAKRMCSYLSMTLLSGSEAESAFMLLKEHMIYAMLEMVAILKARKEVEKMA